MKSTAILIIGAGAAGLMAARELSKAGKKVIILEARDRIGGRIWPVDNVGFDAVIQAGAEFVHGKAPVTKALMKEAGMTITPSEGGMWNLRDGELTQSDQEVPNHELLLEKLKDLKEDITVDQFLTEYFADEKYDALRNSVSKMVEGYDAADPKKISTFAVRDEWLSTHSLEQYRVDEGYNTLLNFFEKELRENNVEVIFKTKVKTIDISTGKVIVTSGDGSQYEAEKVIVTVALPLIKNLEFIPALPQKVKAAENIGFGGVIKIPLQFSERWWLKARGKDSSKMLFMLSNEVVGTWWTRYPDEAPFITGWMAGPKTELFKSKSEEEILSEALNSLSNIFEISVEDLRKKLVAYKVVNWPADPLALGAYSYSTPETKAARTELLKPENNILFFAGEALYEGKDAGTVEGALASGKETAERILNK